MARNQQTTFAVPDGGWGWIIVLASLVFHILMGFIFSSQSVLYLALQDEFGHGKGVTSWILSAFNAVMVFIAPLSASLGVKYGYKAVTFVGGLLISIGFFLSFFANSILYLILAIGVIGGAGAGLAYVPVIAMCALYFDKRRSLAVGLGTSGYGIGNFAFPPLVTLLETEYTWRGVLLIICGSVLNICALALLLRPLRTNQTPPRIQEETNGHIMDGRIEKADGEGDRVTCNGEELTVVSFQELDAVPFNDDLDGVINSKIDHGDQSISCVITGEAFPLPTDELYKSPPKTLIPNSNSTINAAAEIMKRKKYLLPVEVEKSRSQSFNYRSSTSLDRINAKANHSRHYRSAHEISKRMNSNLDIANKQQRKNSTHFESEGRSLTNMSIMLMGSIYNIVTIDSKLNSMLSLSSKTTAMEVESHTNMDDANFDTSPSILHYNDDSSPSIPHQTNNPFHRICEVLKQYRDLLKNIKFSIMIFINLMVSFTYLIPVLYIVDRAVDNGIDKDYAVFALSLYGAGNICGRILTGFIADLPCMNRILLYALCIFFCGLITCLSVFFGSYLPLHNAYGFCFGVLIGGYVILTPLVLVDMLGVEMVGESYGLCLLFQGIAMLTGTPVAGWIRDITGSYKITFALFGSFMVFSSLLNVPLFYWSVKGDNDDEKSQDEKTPLDSSP